MRPISRSLLLAAVLAMPLPGAAAETLTGRVVSVTDGDTLTILTPQQKQVRIRLFGIDAPEKDQLWSQQARRFLSDGVFGRQVRVEVRGTDRYGRALGVVYARTPAGNVLDTNESIVEAGLAWAYVRYSKDYVPQEQRARKDQFGIWKDAKPVPPWEWRDQRRPSRPTNLSGALPMRKGSGRGAKRDGSIAASVPFVPYSIPFATRT